jgi:hypothetical protein
MLHVIDMEYRGGHRLWLQFNDGAEGVVDLGGSLNGTVFDPLRDPREFATAHLDPELHTVAWANGADVAPEFLRGLLKPDMTASA